VPLFSLSSLMLNIEASYTERIGTLRTNYVIDYGSTRVPTISNNYSKIRAAIKLLS